MARQRVAGAGPPAGPAPPAPAPRRDGFTAPAGYGAGGCPAGMGQAAVQESGKTGLISRTWSEDDEHVRAVTGTYTAWLGGGG